MTINNLKLSKKMKNVTSDLKMDEICKRILEIKKIRKLSNQDIAIAGSTTSQTIYAILKGEIKKPNLTILTSICKNLDINLNWLLYGEGQKVEVIPIGKVEKVSKEDRVDNSMWQELYKVAMERIDDLKKEVENRDYTIRLQKNIMQTNGLNFRMVVVKKPTVGRKARLGKLVKLNQELHTEEKPQLQVA